MEAKLARQNQGGKLRIMTKPGFTRVVNSTDPCTGTVGEAGRTDHGPRQPDLCKHNCSMES